MLYFNKPKVTPETDNSSNTQESSVSETYHFILIDNDQNFYKLT